MPRIARVCAPNLPHHITQRGNNKTAVFFGDEDREFYLGILTKYSRLWNLDIWAYCLMSNHVHLLAVPRTDDSLAKGIGSTSLVYTQYFNRLYGRSGRLWQNRFFSAAIEKESYLWAVACYIERNPVRVNIVKNSEDYPWSSAKAHLLGVKDHVLSGETWLAESESNAYREFIMAENKERDEKIRKATSSGRPLGLGEFVRDLEKFLERTISPKSAGRPRREKE